MASLFLPLSSYICCLLEITIILILLALLLIPQIFTELAKFHTVEAESNFALLTTALLSNYFFLSPERNPGQILWLI